MFVFIQVQFKTLLSITSNSRDIIIIYLIIRIASFPFTSYLPDALNKNAEKYLDWQTSRRAILNTEKDFHNLIERSSKGRRGSDLLWAHRQHSCAYMSYRYVPSCFSGFAFLFLEFGESYAFLYRRILFGEMKEKGYPFLQVKHYVGHGCLWEWGGISDRKRYRAALT